MSGGTSRASRISKIEGIAFEDSGPVGVSDGSASDSGRPVLVFGHSLLFDRRMWEPQVAALSKDFRCVAIDFPGHGESDEPARGHTMLDNAEAYRKVMDHLGIESAVIIGLSMGGMAAMPFALGHPGRVRGLVLMDTSADPEPGPARAKNQAMAVTARLFGISDFIMKRVNDLMWSRRFQSEQPALVAEWAVRVKALPRRSIYRAVGAVMGRKGLGARVGEIRCPTLVIVGDEDKATPVAVNQRIASTIGGAELKVLPRTGHIANLEESEVVTKLIRAFLSRVG